MADDPLKPKRPADAAVDPLRDNLKAVAGTDPERTALLNRKDGKAPLQHAIKAVEAALSGDRSDTKMATDDVAPTLAVKGAGQAAVASRGKGSKSEAPAEISPQRQQAMALFPEALERHERIAGEHSEEVAAWIAAHGTGDAGMADGNLLIPKTLSPQQQMYYSINQSEGAIAGALTADEMAERTRGARTLSSKKDEDYRADPFNYDRDELPKETLDALRELGLSEDELIAVQLYTGGASYPMNAVLRGEVTDEASIKAYLPWALKLDSALAKMPATVRNTQKGMLDTAAHPVLDPTQDAGAMLDLSTVNVYRADHWSPFFAKEVQSNWAVGATISNPSFFSTTAVKGSYPGAVQRNIRLKDKQAAASIIDVSHVKHENEVLFRPNTQMKITAIRKVGDVAPVKNTNFERVQNPDSDMEEIAKRPDKRGTNITDFSQYKPEEMFGLGLDVDVVVEGAPGGAKDDKKDAKPAAVPVGKDSKPDKKAQEGAEKASQTALSALLARLMTKKKADK